MTDRGPPLSMSRACLLVPRRNEGWASSAGSLLGISGLPRSLRLGISGSALAKGCPIRHNIVRPFDVRGTSVTVASTGACYGSQPRPIRALGALSQAVRASRGGTAWHQRPS
jgi:hypothetical protein